MKKLLALSCCLLGLVVICMSAYAGGAKITVDCTGAAPDVMTGNATVTLCEGSSLPCSGQAAACPVIACDSSGATAGQTTTISCNTPFKVGSGSYTLVYTIYDGTGAILTSGGGTGWLLMKNGRNIPGGFGINIGGDAFTLAIQ
jgi:hypothetical protein